MRIRSFTKKTTVTAVFLGAMLVASVALAAWLATGTGSGSAKAVTAVNLTTSAATATADLYPGQSNGDLFITVNNPNPYPVTVTEIARTAAAITSDSAACNTGGHAVTMDTPVTVSIGVGAAGSTTTTVADIVNMGAGSDNACQGATFTIPVSLTGTSS